jgi:hypothetical protein
MKPKLEFISSALTAPSYSPAAAPPKGAAKTEREVREEMAG